MTPLRSVNVMGSRPPSCRLPITQRELLARGGPQRGPPFCSQPNGQPPLKGVTSGFVLEYRPAGLGYQTHACRVNRSGCQKKNLAPLPGAVFGQSFWLGSGTKVPSL